MNSNGIAQDNARQSAFYAANDRTIDARPDADDLISLMHAHIDTASADCDGPMYRSRVESMNDEEVTEHAEGVQRGYNDFSDIHFMNRVFVNACGPYAVHQMTVTVDDSGFEWDEATEEGYSRGTVRWCRDDSCDPNYSTQRDVFAEMMGY